MISPDLTRNDKAKQDYSRQERRHAGQHRRRGLRHDLRVRGIAGDAGPAVGRQRRRPAAPLARQRQDAGRRSRRPVCPSGARSTSIELSANERRPRDRDRVSLHAERLHALRVPDQRLRQDVEADRRRQERHPRRRLHARGARGSGSSTGCSMPAPSTACTSRSTRARTGSASSRTCRSTPIMDLKVYRKNLIVATEGRAFWIVDALPVVQQLKAGLESTAAVAVQARGRVSPGRAAADVLLLVQGAAGRAGHAGSEGSQRARWSTPATAQPGAGTALQPPPPIAPVTPAFGGGRGGRGGGGRGAGADAPPAAEPGAVPVQPPAEGAQLPPAGRGGGGGGRGRGGFGGGATVVTAQPGLNQVTWNPRFDVAVHGSAAHRHVGRRRRTRRRTEGRARHLHREARVWYLVAGAGVPAQHRPAPAADDRRGRSGAVEDGDGGRQPDQGALRQLAKLRDAKQQASQNAEKSGASSPVTAAAQKLKQQLEGVEGDITQLKGEAGQDALNFPGRIDARPGGWRARQRPPVLS